MAELVGIADHQADKAQRGVQPGLKLEPFQLYGNLPLGGSRCIRVLDLFNEDESAPGMLRGALRVVDLQTSPEFTALSYTWGNLSPVTDVISCNDVDLPVTKSCYDALRSLRRIRRGTTTTIWVDAICINQQDSDEKNVQIPLMHEIFTWAQVVYIWLGPGNHQTDKAIQWLSYVTRLQPSTPGIPWIDGRKRRTVFGDRLRSVAGILVADFKHGFCRNYAYDLPIWVMTHFDDLTVGDLDALLDREWLHRAWTFQEVLLASNPVLFCGERMIKWAQLQGGLQIFQLEGVPYLPLYQQVSANCKAIRDSNDGELYRRRTTEFRNRARDNESSAISAWKQLFQLWLATSRPMHWNGIRLRQLPRTGSRAVDRQSVQIYHEDVLRVGQLVWFKNLTWVCLVMVVFAVLVTNAALGPFVTTFACCMLIGLFAFVVGFRVIALLRRPRRRDAVVGRQDAVAVKGIVQAIRERHASIAKDKSFAMHGVLRSLDMTLSPPNYDAEVGHIYKDLFTDLVKWTPGLINLLVDVGPPSMAEKPSWVPDWSTIQERSWLPQTYIYDNMQGGAETSSNPRVTFSGTEMSIPGIRIGNITLIVEPFEHVDERDLAPSANGPEAELIRRTLRVLVQWLTLLRSNAPVNEHYDSVPRAAYDVLNGRVSDGSTTASATTFSESFRILVKPGDTRGEEDAEEVMISELEQKPEALGEIVNLTNGMVGKRGLFYSADGHFGSALLHAAEGDEILVLQGVAVPMIARPQRREMEDDAIVYTLIGPAFVVGFMGLWDFDPGTLQKEWEEFRFQ